MIPGTNGKKIGIRVSALIVIALMVVIMQGMRIFVLIETGNDDTTLVAAANVLLTAFVTAVAAERVASHLGKDGE